MIAEVEMCLSDIVHAAVRDGEILDRVRARKSKGAGRIQKARAAGQDTRIVEYLDLRDLIDLFPSRVDTDVPADVKASLGEMPDFRNVVTHPAKLLARDYPAAELAALDQRICVARDYVCSAGGSRLGREGWFGV